MQLVSGEVMLLGILNCLPMMLGVLTRLTRRLMFGTGRLAMLKLIDGGCVLLTHLPWALRHGETETLWV